MTDETTSRAGRRPRDGRRAAVDAPAARADRGLADQQGSTPTAAGSRRELFVWYLMRVTGVMLFVLALAHFSILHFIWDPAEQTADFIANERWNQIFWRGFDWLLLMTVLFHGFLGVRTVVLDYVHRPRAARRSRCCCSTRLGVHPVRHRHAGHPDPADATAQRRGHAFGDRPAAVHDYQAVIVGAGGAGLWAALELARIERQDGGADQALSDSLAHRRRPGRHLRRARQHRGRPPRVAHVRHGQGRRLPGRPGRGRDPGPRGDRDRHRARAHGPAVQSDGRRQDRPASLRWPHAQLRRGAGAPSLLRGRPNRAT